MRQNFSVPKKIFLLVCFIASGFFSYGIVRYVKTGGAGTAPYTSWLTAGNDLQAVINQCGAGDEIWIATGTYKPNRRADALTVITATDRFDAFVLKSGVKIYGGFIGTETLLSQRNSATNVVTLSGDIGTLGVTTDNCYHVVISAGIVSTTTLLDGVTISGGNANATAFITSITVNTHTISPRFGGGMFKVSSNTDITNCRFSRNNATVSGAGIYETLSAVNSVYNNCIISQNISTGNGGGLYILTSSCLYQNCSFTNNDADDGAGIYLSGSGSPAFTGCAISSNDAINEGGAVFITGTGSPSFFDCTMNSNTATSNGGAVSNATTGILELTSTIISGNTSGSAGGAVYNNNSPAALTNCLISGNLAVAGAGIWNSFSDAVIINCTIAGNRATTQGGGIADGSSNPTIQNCIVYGNTGVPSSTNSMYDAGSAPVITYCLIEGLLIGTGSISGDPLFINRVAASAAPTTTGDYHIQPCSPVLNAGENSYIPSGITTDIDGNPRINYGFVDMGAYEKQLQLAVPDANGIVYVDYTKTGNGSSWANAVADLSDALVAARFNSSILQVWVAKGTYHPKYVLGYRSLKCYLSYRYSTFQLTNNIKLYGGFAPGETDTTTRNFVLNETILSGDIGTPDDKTDNCYNVLQSGLINVAYINGLTVTRGNDSYAGGGAGLKNTSLSMKVSHCIFSENEATNGGIGSGGGILNEVPGTLYISYSSFLSNVSVSQGGGILSETGGRAKIDHCTFKDNKSANGAGIHITDNTGFSSVSSCIFSGNESTNLGGAMCSHSRIDINNALFSGNKSVMGGALHLDGPPSTITNCTIASNLSTGNGSAIFGGASVATIRNCIIYGNDGPLLLFAGAPPAITNSVVQGVPLYTGTGNTNSNPLFIGSILASAAPVTAGDYHLQKCAASPAIDAGDNSAIPVGITTDLDEQVRIVHTNVDMGAYETHYAFQSGGKVYVDKTKTGKGTSWADAAPELADALKEAKYNSGINEIWVAKGTYNPLYNAADGTETFCNIPGRDNAFVLVNNVKLYGGFAGGETDTSGRNFVANETIMSGDIGLVNDTSDNCYHVAISAGAVGSAVLDGFGILNGISSISTSPLVNTKLINSGKGGGVYITESSPVIKNCSLRNNYAYDDGGGMYLYHSTPVITNCSIAGNLANRGGGIALYDLSPALFSNCIITGNKAYIPSNILTDLGGGVYIHYTDPTFYNCTIAGNFGIVGNDILTYGTPIIKNSIIQWLSSIPVNGSNVTYSYVNGGHPGTGNISSDPLFTSPVIATLANTPNTLGDYHLQQCSPAINIGDNSTVISLTDLDRNTRIKYTTVDMGAYEVQTIDLANTTWKGINTNWNDKINWCGGYIPFDTTNVIIPSSLANYPTIGSGFTNGVKNILLGNGSSVGITSTGSLTINGTYTNNGSTIANNGNWIMAGSSASQAFPGTSATVSAMNNLEIKNPSGVSFDKSFSITGSIIPTAGNINVNNSIAITLRSTEAATASVDVIQPAASVSYTGTGAFIVERFINTGTNTGIGQHAKSWQFLSTPTTGQTIFQSWQENGTAPAGFGTWITGTGTGFDVTTAGASIKYFNQAGINWTGVTNTGTVLVNKLGYMLFVRGDRTVTTYNGTPNNTIMRSKGQLFSPTNAAPSVPVTANKFQSFGNPYASRIEFNKVFTASTGINDVFYVWDPKLAGTYNLGGYQTISGIAGYIPTVGTPPTGNAATAYYPAGVAAPYIESGQAVFVKGNGTGGNVNFNESVKATGSRLVNRPAGNNSIAHRQFLFTTLFTNTGVIADGNIVAFERGFGNNINEHDAVKLMNSGENFGLTRNDIVLAIEAHEKLVANDTIFYSMSNLREQGYQLRFAPVNMQSLNLQPLLVDRYKNTTTILSVTDSSYVDFMVTADMASAAANRFFIVFQRKHRSPAADTEKKYSKPVKGMIDDKGQLISVYPNPVINQEININMKELPVGKYQYGLYNSTGQLMASGVFDYTKASITTLIKLATDLAPGIYQLKLLHEASQVAVITVNIQ